MVETEIVRVVSLRTTEKIEIPRFNPFPNDKMLDASKLKGFADDNSKFDENGRKLPNWIENTV